MEYAFRWIKWNVNHIAEHGVTTDEAEYVVNNYAARKTGDNQYLAIGQTQDGNWIQVAFTFDPPGVVFVFHARPLTDAEKRRYRKRRRRK